MEFSPTLIRRVIALSLILFVMSMLVSMDIDTEEMNPKIIPTPKAIPVSKAIASILLTTHLDVIDSAQYVLDAYLQTIGGKERWTKVRTIHTNGLMSLKAGSSMPLIYGKDMYQGHDGYLLEEITVNDSRLSQVMQNGGVMTVVRDNSYAQTGLNALAFKEYLLPIGDFNQHKAPIAQYLGKHLLNGKLMHKLFLGNQLGYDVNEYYDVNSNLKTRVTFGDACTIEFGRYKAISGLRIPSLIEARFTDFGKRVTYEVEQIELNVSIPASPIDLKTLSIASN